MMGSQAFFLMKLLGRAPFIESPDQPKVPMRRMMAKSKRDLGHLRVI